MNRLGIIGWLGLASRALAAEPVALTELKPAATEYGMVNWLEYDVPAGATRFTAKLYVTDDPRGYVFYDRPINQQFAFTAAVDGREVARESNTELVLHDAQFLP
jgi:hypothetical protein